MHLSRKTAVQSPFTAVRRFPLTVAPGLHKLGTDRQTNNLVGHCPSTVLRGIIMRTLIAIALVASTGFATLAQAQTSAAQDASSVRIQGVSSIRTPMTDEQFADFGGKYMLSNGKRLTVSSN